MHITRAITAAAGCTALTLGGLTGVVAAPAGADCFVSDGTARDGTSRGGSPPEFYFAPYGVLVGAHYDSCNAAVRVTYGMPEGGEGNYNLAYGQRPASDGPIAIFSNQVERSGGTSEMLFNTRPANVRVYAFFRAQSCTPIPLSSSDCTPWSPNITIDLGNNNLTEY